MKTWLLLLVSAVSLFGQNAATTLQVADVFSDNMVLQRDIPIPVWGTARPGESIQVQFNHQTRHTTTAPDGQWRIDLPAQSAGGPFKLQVIGPDTLNFCNVLVGEVWLCSGQSNMAMSVNEVEQAEIEIAGADYPLIRLFNVDHVTSPIPLRGKCGVDWEICTPRSAANFSAVGYFFGRHLHQKLNIPIGLINASYGGTMIEAWTSARSLRNIDNLHSDLVSLEKFAAGDSSFIREYHTRLTAWKINFNGADPAFQNPAQTWKDADFDASHWDSMAVPGLWQTAELANFDGAVWFRTEFSVSSTGAGKDAVLSLGPIDDIDVTWLNGIYLGSGEQWDVPRQYTIPAGILKAGPNVLAIRVHDTGGPGGIWGEVNQYFLKTSSGDSIPLAGNWRYQQSLTASQIPPRPLSFDNPNCPTVLFNGMVSPLIPYALRGVIWYQGESNCWNAWQYRTLFPLLINDWRQHWHQGDFPFLYVQLANFLAPATEPEESDWAELREAQLMTLATKNTGMAVIIDVGDAVDIHPKNKQAVGNRLALIARKQVHREKIEASGPIFQSQKRRGNQIQLTFKYLAGGLKIKGEVLQGFTIAGADRKFYRAQAKIKGAKVLVWSDQVPEPVAVRYGWAANPPCNLYNQAGLPASPFRTDNWPGITAPRPGYQ